MSNEDFDVLVRKAMSGRGLGQMRPVIEKELLHYDILFALDKNGLLKDLVFQGGTSLRLCYGGNRFSEDLDFAGGVCFSSQDLLPIKSCIEDYLTKRYELEVTVKEPSTLKKETQSTDLKIDKWQVAITTAPGRPDLPRQRIKLEVANIPAHTKTLRPLMRNYDFLPDGYEDMLVTVETMDEIVADKLVSLPATEKYIRHRDIWDLVWLKQQGAEFQIDLLERKVKDYQLRDYDLKLNALQNKLHDIIESKVFDDEMRRFIPADVYERTLAREGFRSYLESALKEWFDQVQAERTNGNSAPEFQM